MESRQNDGCQQNEDSDNNQKLSECERKDRAVSPAKGCHGMM
jgi:hypothetical protein